MFACEAAEADGIARAQLSEFPEFALDYRGRADKTAEAGAVGPEDDWHVAGEVDRPDGVGVIVYIRGMEPGFAAVGSRPLRLGADQAHARAGGVVVDLPIRLEKRSNILRGKEIRGTMRPVEDPDFPRARQLRLLLGCHSSAIIFEHRGRLCLVCGLDGAGRSHIKHIAEAEGASAMAAEATEGESRFTAQIIRDIDPARHGEIGANSAADSFSDIEDAVGRNPERRVEFDGLAVYGGVHWRTRQHGPRRTVEAQLRSGRGNFETGGVFRIPEECVAETESERIHRTGRGHSDFPVADAARKILHCGHRAGAQHLEAGRLIREVAQRAGHHPALAEDGRVHDLAEVVQVCLDPNEPGFGERRCERIAGRIAILRMHLHLGKQRIVVGRHFAAAFHPVVATHSVRKGHVSEQAAGGLEIFQRIFGVEPGLDGVAPLRKNGGIAGSGPLPRRQLDHPPHQIDAGDEFGHSVLDLKTCVHLEKIKLRGVVVVDELDRPRRAVGDRRSETDGRLLQGLQGVRCDAGRRRLFDHLLVAPLGGAVAHAERMDRGASVAEDLHFEVARVLDEFFQKYPALPEVAPAESLHPAKGVFQLVRAVADLHTDAPAARRALEHDRVADGRRRLERSRLVLEQRTALQQRHAVFFGDAPGLMLQAEFGHLRRRRPDKGDPRSLAGFREGRVFA